MQLGEAGRSAALPGLLAGFDRQEQVPVEAEEVTSIAAEVSKVLRPGVDLISREAEGPNEVGHDADVRKAIGVGVVLGVEDDEDFPAEDLKPGGPEPVRQRARQMRVGKSPGPEGQDTAHEGFIGGIPDDGVPVRVEDDSAGTGTQDSLELCKRQIDVLYVLVDLG
jgi:hypothetical protein